jgi:hypothetical protein
MRGQVSGISDKFEMRGQVSGISDKPSNGLFLNVL